MNQAAQAVLAKQDPSNEQPTSSNVRRETFKIPEEMTGVPKQELEPVRTIEGFNSLLANEYAVFTKTLNYHWNVTGPRFHSIHEFLDEQYHELLKVIDGVAERIRKIGGFAIGTLQELKQSASLMERPGEQPDATSMIADLVADHESIQLQIKTLLKDIDLKGRDPGSEDFLTGLLRTHEEMAWMLKSHLEKQ